VYNDGGYPLRGYTKALEARRWGIHEFWKLNLSWFCYHFKLNLFIQGRRTTPISFVWTTRTSLPPTALVGSVSGSFFLRETFVYYNYHSKKIFVIIFLKWTQFVALIGFRSFKHLNEPEPNKAMFSSIFFLRFSVTSNVWTHAWSIKCRWKNKLITQFGKKPLDESFEPN
jgi:hypothetical protein